MECPRCGHRMEVIREVKGDIENRTYICMKCGFMFSTKVFKPPKQ